MVICNYLSKKRKIIQRKKNTGVLKGDECVPSSA